MRTESCVANAKYTYIHDNHKGSLETLDSHHVVVRKSSAKAFISIIIMPAFGVQLETHYSRCQTGKRKSWCMELHPPVKMLIPIWKALCAATDNPVTQVPSR
ncbi:unnamed protein product [Camellia sinensis]